MTSYKKRTRLGAFFLFGCAFRQIALGLRVEKLGVFAAPCHQLGVRVYCDGKSFCVHVQQINNPKIHTDDMAGWFITIAVPDSMVETCTEFDADLNNIEN